MRRTIESLKWAHTAIHVGPCEPSDSNPNSKKRQNSKPKSNPKPKQERKHQQAPRVFEVAQSSGESISCEMSSARTGCPLDSQPVVRSIRWYAHCAASLHVRASVKTKCECASGVERRAVVQQLFEEISLTGQGGRSRHAKLS
jgi:hypothetical protein